MAIETTFKANLPIEIQESIWLAEVRMGYSVHTIALRDNLSRQRIRFGVTRARLREAAKTSRLERIAAEEARRRESGMPPETAPAAPRLVPLFPIGPLVPTSKCGHNGPIRAGSSFCCMICHASGKDDHPALKRDPATDPAPESSTNPLPAAKDLAPKSSRRRLKQHRRTQAAIQN